MQVETKTEMPKLIKNNKSCHDGLDDLVSTELVREGADITYTRGENKFTDKQIAEWKLEMMRINPLIPEEMVDNILDTYQTHPHIIDRIVEQHKKRKIEVSC